MNKIATLLAVATKNCFGRMFRTRRALKVVVLYVLFDLLIGGYNGGLLPLTQMIAFSQNGTPPFNPAFPNNVGGAYIASEYGKWQVQSLTTSTSTGAYSMTLNPCYVSVGTGNKKIFPFAVNVPVTVIDGTSTETVTPTAVSVPSPAVGPSTGPNPYSCSFTATFTYAHYSGVFIVSGDSGLEEAINDALVTGGGGGAAGAGPVVLDSNWGGTTSTLTSALVYPKVQIVDYRQPGVQYWNPTQAVSTLFAAPTTLTATTVGFGINGANTTGGTYTGTSTYYVCIAYVDVMGQEGPCSATFSSLTAGTGSTNQIGIAAPAAATGAVGYTVYISLASGSYALAYQAPLTSTTCTLTVIESVTPACAVTNATYGQTGSNAVISALTVNTAPLYTALGGTNNQYTGNSNGRTSYLYAPSNKPLFQAPIVSQAYTATPGSAASTNPVVLGTVNLPAGFMNFAGKTIRVCGKYKMTFANSPTIENIQVYWDAAGSDTTGTPVQLANIQGSATYTNAAYNGTFCESFSTTVAGASATAGSIIGGFNVASVGLVSAPVNLITEVDTLNAAVASLNLANTAVAGYSTHLDIVQNHTTGSDGIGQLTNLTVEII